ncbi:MAG: Calx-beta domain-containing protein, partial [Bacteroidota bacterium]
VDVTINSNSTADDGSDYTGFSDTTLVFPPGDLSQQNLSIQIEVDGVTEGAEFIFVNLQNPVGANLGKSLLTITIVGDDPSYPYYPTGLVTADQDGNGITDSLGVSCEVRGLVYGGNIIGGSSIQYVVRDPQHGIAVYTDGTPEVEYHPVQGDSIRVQGFITHNQGLAWLLPTQVYLISSDNIIRAPLVVNELNETTESEYVQLRCVTLVDAAEWPDLPIDPPFHVTNGVDTFLIEPVFRAELYTIPPPVGWFDITGIGSQRDENEPALGGYKLVPQFVYDVELRPLPHIQFTTPDLSLPEADSNLNLTLAIESLNPDSSFFSVTVDSSSTATLGSDFNFVSPEINAVGCDSMRMLDLSLEVLDDADIEGTETIVLVLSALANGETGPKDTLRIEITETDAVSDLLDDAIKAYPNPTQNLLHVEGQVRMIHATLSNINGQVLRHQAIDGYQADMSLTDLPPGLYILRVETVQGAWIQKVVRE